MKVLKNMMLREIAGEYVLVPVWGDTVDFNGVVMLNEVSAFIWEHLEECENERQLTGLVTDEFEIDEETAYNDICEVIETFRKSGIIE